MPKLYVVTRLPKTGESNPEPILCYINGKLSTNNRLHAVIAVKEVTGAYGHLYNYKIVRVA